MLGDINLFLELSYTLNYNNNTITGIAFIRTATFLSPFCSISLSPPVDSSESYLHINVYNCDYKNCFSPPFCRSIAVSRGVYQHSQARTAVSLPSLFSYPLVFLLSSFHPSQSMLPALPFSPNVSPGESFVELKVRNDFRFKWLELENVKSIINTLLFIQFGPA